MDNKNDDDFTFCQVSSPSDTAGFVEQNMVPGISNITINDEASSRNCDDVIDLWNCKAPSGATSVKEGKIGSLSFSVVNTISQTQSEDLPKQGGGPFNNPAENKPMVKKPAARAKVPFEKGYSQMDWLKLTRTHPDLAGLNGQSNRRLISMSEVKQHQTEGSMWTVLKGRVYNIYPYLKFHPGGVDILMKAVGKDCTSLFNKYHAWVNAEFLLEKCLVGILDENSGGK